MAIFEICPFLTAAGLFKVFSKNGCLQKMKDIMITVHGDLHIMNWLPMNTQHII